MKSDSKNLGITKACPDCKRTLLKSAKFSGIGSLEMKCPHCGAKVLIEIGQKSSITTTKIVLLCLVAILATSFLFNMSQTTAEGIRCSDFESQGQAQDLLSSNPILFHGLDRDKNGIACQSTFYKK